MTREKVFQLLQKVLMIIMLNSIYMLAENIPICSECKFVNSSDAVYCIKCGSRLTPPVDKREKPTVKYKKYGIGIIEIGSGNDFSGLGFSVLSLKYIGDSGWGIEILPLSIYFSESENIKERTGVRYNFISGEKEIVTIQEKEYVISSYYFTTLIKYNFLRSQLISIYFGIGTSLQGSSYSCDIYYYDLQGKFVDFDFKLSENVWGLAPVFNLGIELISKGVFRFDINFKYFLGRSIKSFPTDIGISCVGISINW